MTATGERRLVCERCGREFGCSPDDPGNCWCAAEPYRLTMPTSASRSQFRDCLCPSCLPALAAQTGRNDKQTG